MIRHTHKQTNKHTHTPACLPPALRADQCGRGERKPVELRWSETGIEETIGLNRLRAGASVEPCGDVQLRQESRGRGAGGGRRGEESRNESCGLYGKHSRGVGGCSLIQRGEGREGRVPRDLGGSRAALHLSSAHQGWGTHVLRACIKCASSMCHASSISCFARVVHAMLHACTKCASSRWRACVMHASCTL